MRFMIKKENNIDQYISVGCESMMRAEKTSVVALLECLEKRIDNIIG